MNAQNGTTSLENKTSKYTDLISEIETGEIKIPQFQRKFVWGLKTSAKLIDSIMKGYPIGILIFWRTKERLRSIRNLGNISLPEPIDGEYVNYVLDGQQRLTSFYAAIKGISIKDENGVDINYSEIYIDLTAHANEDIVITEIDGKEPTDIVKLKDLTKGSLTKLAKYPEKHHKLIEHYKNVITSYAFPIMALKNAPIEIATEIFTRMNVYGKPLTLFEIMVAKTYHVFPKNPKNIASNTVTFDLAEKYEELTTDLKECQYNTISSSTILQVVAILLEKECTRKSILNLDKMKFIGIWDEAIECIKSSIDFFRGYGIPVGRILPYNALLVPFSYFFFKYKQKPIGEIKKRLEDYFWRASLGFRYSSGVESKLVQDIAKIDKIISGKLPKYEWAVDISNDFIENHGWFSTGKSLIKAILCLYAKQKPKSFDNNSDIIIDNSWLKIASSKNYHHFFPKAWMAKNDNNIEYHKVNHIVNITIVDDFLNKVSIKAQSPNQYMKKFIKNNNELSKTMKTHLIDIDRDGIWENRYDIFYKNRLKRITKALNKFIIQQEHVSGNLEIYEDIEDIEE